MKRISLYLTPLGILLLLAGCAGRQTFLVPASPVAAEEASLYQVIFYMALGVFILVWGLLIYNILRFHRRRNQTGEPRQKYGNWRLEFVWTAIPVLLVLILFVLTVRTIIAVAAPKSQPTDINVHIIGHQWWWEFDYPDLGVVTANELHIPTGANVHVSLDSVDVIHSFWAPELSHKMDVIPGQTNHLWFEVDRAGTYTGQCAEFCGLNHANMRIRVIADSPADFDTWVKDQQAAAYQPATPDEQKALDLITKGICSNCHTLGDNQAVNPIGPDLTHLASRTSFAGDMYDLNPENLRSWLTDPQAMKPGNDMVVNLTPDQVNILVDFLMKLK